MANTTTRYYRCTSHQTTYTCFCRHIPNTLRAILYGQSRALQHERCGNSTNLCYKNTCGVEGSGKNRTTWGRLVTFRPRRLNSTSSERNTFSRAYGLHLRGQAPRHSACSACRPINTPNAVVREAALFTTRRMSLAKHVKTGRRIFPCSTQIIGQVVIGRRLRHRNGDIERLLMMG